MVTGDFPRNYEAKLVTQAQIEAAARTIDADLRVSIPMAKAALIAAAEVGEQQPITDVMAAHMARWESTLIANTEARTIERCAQVADAKATEIEAWSHQDSASRLAAEMLRKAAAAIRALKDQP